MSWNPDRPVIEYLERRVKYYKKKIGSTKTMMDDKNCFNHKYVIEVYGKKGAVPFFKKRIQRLELRVSEYQKAIEILKPHFKPTPQ